MVDEMIEHASVKVAQTKKKPQNKKSKTVLVVISVVLIIAALIGGFYWGKISGKRTFNFADLTSDWQIYKSNDYGFSFKYPKEWNVGQNEGKDGFIISREGKNIIAFNVYNKRGVSIKEPQYAIQISVPFGKTHYLIFSTSTENEAKDIFYNIAATLEFNK